MMEKANEVLVVHADFSFAKYVHLRKGGIAVKEGDRVKVRMHMHPRTYAHTTTRTHTHTYTHIPTHAYTHAHAHSSHSRICTAWRSAGL